MSNTNATSFQLTSNEGKEADDDEIELENISISDIGDSDEDDDVDSRCSQQGNGPMMKMVPADGGTDDHDDDDDDDDVSDNSSEDNDDQERTKKEEVKEEEEEKEHSTLEREHLFQPSEAILEEHAQIPPPGLEEEEEENKQENKRERAQQCRSPIGSPRGLSFDSLRQSSQLRQEYPRMDANSPVIISPRHHGHHHHHHNHHHHQQQQQQQEQQNSHSYDDVMTMRTGEDEVATCSNSFPIVNDSLVHSNGLITESHYRNGNDSISGGGGDGGGAHVSPAQQQQQQMRSPRKDLYTVQRDIKKLQLQSRQTGHHQYSYGHQLQLQLQLQQHKQQQQQQQQPLYLPQSPLQQEGRKWSRVEHGTADVNVKAIMAAHQQLGYDKDELAAYVKKPKTSVKRLKQLCLWLNSLGIWPSHVLNTSNLFRTFRDGLLLCRLLEVLGQAKYTQAIIPRPVTKKSCIHNLELALAFLWQNRRIVSSRIPTAEQLYEADFHHTEVLVLLNEIFDVFVMANVKNELPEMLTWYNHVFKQFHKGLPSSALTPPRYKGLWAALQSGTRLFCVFRHYFSSAEIVRRRGGDDSLNGPNPSNFNAVNVNSADIFAHPKDLAEYRLNVAEVFSMVAAAGLPLLFEVQDWLTYPDSSFFILQLHGIYQGLQERVVLSTPCTIVRVNGGNGKGKGKGRGKRGEVITTHANKVSKCNLGSQGNESNEGKEEASGEGIMLGRDGRVAMAGIYFVDCDRDKQAESVRAVRLGDGLGMSVWAPPLHYGAPLLRRGRLPGLFALQPVLEREGTRRAGGGGRGASGGGSGGGGGFSSSGGLASPRAEQLSPRKKTLVYLQKQMAQVTAEERTLTEKVNVMRQSQRQPPQPRRGVKRGPTSAVDVEAEVRLEVEIERLRLMGEKRNELRAALDQVMCCFTPPGTPRRGGGGGGRDNGDRHNASFGNEDDDSRFGSDGANCSDGGGGGDGGGGVAAPRSDYKNNYDYNSSGVIINGRQHRRVGTSISVLATPTSPRSFSVARRSYSTVSSPKSLFATPLSSSSPCRAGENGMVDDGVPGLSSSFDMPAGAFPAESSFSTTVDGGNSNSNNDSGNGGGGGGGGGGGSGGDDSGTGKERTRETGRRIIRDSTGSGDDDLDATGVAVLRRDGMFSTSLPLAMPTSTSSSNSTSTSVFADLVLSSSHSAIKHHQQQQQQQRQQDGRSTTAPGSYTDVVHDDGNSANRLLTYHRPPRISTGSTTTATLFTTNTTTITAASSTASPAAFLIDSPNISGCLKPTLWPSKRKDKVPVGPLQVTSDSSSSSSSVSPSRTNSTLRSPGKSDGQTARNVTSGGGGGGGDDDSGGDGGGEGERRQTVDVVCRERETVLQQNEQSQSDPQQQQQQQWWRQHDDEERAKSVFQKNGENVDNHFVISSDGGALLQRRAVPDVATIASQGKSRKSVVISEPFGADTINHHMNDVITNDVSESGFSAATNENINPAKEGRSYVSNDYNARDIYSKDSTTTGNIDDKTSREVSLPSFSSLAVLSPNSNDCVGPSADDGRGSTSPRTDVGSGTGAGVAHQRVYECVRFANEDRRSMHLMEAVRISNN